VNRLLTAFLMFSFLFAIVSWSPAQELYTLTNVTLQKDSHSFSNIKVILSFDTPPASFPVYAMTNPDRIIIDLVNTQAKDSLFPIKSNFNAITSIVKYEQEMSGSPNTRVEIHLTSSVHYVGHLKGNNIILSLNFAGPVKSSKSLFKSDNTDITAVSMTAMDIVHREKTVELSMDFTSLPKTASIYMMHDPARIVMDFYNVTLGQDGFVKDIDIAPIKNVTVIKKDGQPPYTGIIVMLKKKTNFQYKQTGNRIVVNIPLKTKSKWNRKRLILISAGILLTGGAAATGALVGGDQPPPADVDPETQDLGEPPPLP